MRTRARRWAARLGVAALLGVGLPLAGSVAPAHAAVQWIDGAFSNSQILSCTGIIFGNPYTEIGMMSSVGYLGDPSSSTPKPAVGEAFKVHVTVAATGNPCAGQFAQPSLALPAGLGLVGTQPAKCTWYHDNRADNMICTAVHGSDGRYYFRNSDNTTIWPMPTGTILDLQLDVSASAQIVSTLQGFVSVADGNDNPTLTPSVGIYVLPTGNGGAVQTRISYADPSTVITPGNPPVHDSRGYVVAPSGGTVRFDIGLVANTYVGSTTETIPSGGTWFERALWTYGDGMGGTTYHWRLCFTPTGGSTTCGSDQTFTAISADSTRPTVTSTTLVNPRLGIPSDPIVSPTITVRFQFSEPVTGVEDSLFESAGGVTVPVDAVTTVSPRSGDTPVYASTYTVTVDTGVGQGTRGVGISTFLANTHVKDRAGNTLLLGTSVTATVSRSTVDVGAPSISVAALPAVTLTPKFTATWTASDAASGLGYFVVQSRPISAGGTAEAFSTPGAVLAPNSRSTQVSIAAKTTRCVKVTAFDASDNSTVGTVRCTTAPADDRAAGSSGSWSNDSSSSAYKGTLSRSTDVGASKSLTGVKAAKVVVVAEKRPGAGKVEVVVNGTVRATLSLASSTRRSKQVMVVTLPSTVTNATVKVRVKTAGSSGVRLDGIGVIPA